MNSIFKYTENNGEVIITGLKKGVSDTSIVIPETINGKPVVAIGPKAFKSTSITAIKIGKNIRKIEKNAFHKCEKLSSVTWNCKCNAIPADCFSECSNLTNFDFSSIKKIRQYSFWGSGLISVTISKGTAVYQSCFAFCENLTKVEWLSARSIKEDIFKECKDIKEIYISDKVKNIEARAFVSSPNAEINFV